jgi:hypothetical protein
MNTLFKLKHLHHKFYPHILKRNFCIKPNNNNKNNKEVYIPIASALKGADKRQTYVNNGICILLTYGTCQFLYTLYLGKYHWSAFHVLFTVFFLLVQQSAKRNYKILIKDAALVKKNGKKKLQLTFFSDDIELFDLAEINEPVPERLPENLKPDTHWVMISDESYYFPTKVEIHDLKMFDALKKGTLMEYVKRNNKI